MNATRMVSGEDRTTAVEYDPMPRRLRTAPIIEFVTERRHGWTQEQLAHASTGHNRVTGNLTVGVGIRRRRNGLVRFDGDLWRLDLDLHPDTITRIADYWDRLNRATPMKTQTRMEWHFSRTFLQFDALEGQADDWRDFLQTVLADVGNYGGVRCQGVAPDSEIRSCTEGI